MATIEEAIAEAYASAPQDTIVLHTLELNHKSFTEPARVCRWPVTDNEPETFLCRLEDDAPYNPGQRVAFVGLPFEITLPEQSTDTSGSFSLRLSNIGDNLDGYLENAALSGGPITAIYRTFIKDRENEGPTELFAGINIKSPRLEGQTVVTDGSVFDWMGKAFGRLYTPSLYPRLVASRD